LPCTTNVATRKQALTVPLPAPIYWQSRHQHTRVTTGGAELSQRIAPQKHRPVIVMVAPGQEGNPYPPILRRSVQCRQIVRRGSAKSSGRAKARCRPGGSRVNMKRQAAEAQWHLQRLKADAFAAQFAIASVACLRTAWCVIVRAVGASQRRRSSPGLLFRSGNFSCFEGIRRSSIRPSPCAAPSVRVAAAP